MSLDELSKLSKGDRIDLSEMPNEIVMTLTNFRFGKDRMGKECLFCDFKTRDNKTLTQKYSSIHMPDLIEALKKLKLDHINGLSKSFFLFKTKMYRIGNPRLLPVKEVKE